MSDIDYQPLCPNCSLDPCQCSDDPCEFCGCSPCQCSDEPCEFCGCSLCQCSEQLTTDVCPLCGEIDCDCLSRDFVCLDCGKELRQCQCPDIMPELPELCPSCALEPDECECDFSSAEAEVSIALPVDIYERVKAISEDNGQSLETTIVAALDRLLADIPLYIPVDPAALGFFYAKSGRSLAQTIGPVKSVRLEVIR